LHAHPTDDHYLPLLYAVGAAGTDTPRFFNEEIFAGSVSMRCVVFG
jgi:4,5-DOPA dioxygenase extradiol